MRRGDRVLAGGVVLVTPVRARLDAHGVDFRHLVQMALKWDGSAYWLGLHSMRG